MMKDLQRALMIGTALAGMIGLSSAATAQTVAADDTAKPVEDEIVVTAQRRSETLERTPVAIAVVSAEALAKQGVTSETRPAIRRTRPDRAHQPER